METIFSQQKKKSRHRSNHKLSLKDNSSKLTLFQYSKHKISPPKFLIPISLIHVHSNTIDTIETRVKSSLISPTSVKTSRKFLRSKREVHWSESPDPKSDNFSTSTCRPGSAMEEFKKLLPKRHIKHHNSMKEASNERMINLYGAHGRRNFSNDEKQRIVKRESNAHHTSNITKYYEHYQKKSKELLKKLQISVLSSKNEYASNLSY